MCGGTDLVKQDGVFVCQSCGFKNISTRDNFSKGDGLEQPNTGYFIGFFIGMGIGIILGVATKSVVLGALFCVVLMAMLGYIGGIIHEMCAQKKKPTENMKPYVIVVVCVILAAALCTQCSKIDLFTPRKSKYDDVFKKDPNTWTEDEKEYVNNFFKWLDEKDTNK